MIQGKDEPIFRFPFVQPWKLESLVENYIQGIDSGTFDSRSIHFIATSTLRFAYADPHLREIIYSKDAICDSSILVRILKIKESEFREIRGGDFFRCYFLQENGLRHFIVAPTQITLNSLMGMHPKSSSVNGIVFPYVKRITEVLSSIIEKIRLQNPHFIWIGIGSPKQDYLAYELSQVVNGICVSIGAGMEFVAQTKREIPSFLKGSGLEWAFRLFMEPVRLFPRYLKDFLFLTKILFKSLRSNFRSE